MTQRIDTLLNQATSELSQSPTARLDAELLLSHSLRKPRTYFFTWPEKELSLEEFQHFQKLDEKRKQGIPVAHLTGEREFWRLNLKVTEATLIPRPDTELLVELALAQKNPADARVIDLGTGTGAIALAMACERPQWQLTATDKSPEALQVAKENAVRNRITNVEFLEGSWCEPLQQNNLPLPFDMAVSNPPYIRSDDNHLDEGDVRFEPLTALASGKDGLDDIRIIARESLAILKPEGYLLLEHGHDQGFEVRKILEEAGFINARTEQDLAGHDRVSMAQKKA